MLTAAVFEIVQQNVLTADPTNVFFRCRPVRRCAGSSSRPAATSRASSRSSAATATSIRRSRKQSTARSAISCSTLRSSRHRCGRNTPGTMARSRGLGLARASATSARTTAMRQYPSYPVVHAVRRGDQLRLHYLRPDLKGWSAQVNATNLANDTTCRRAATGSAYCSLGVGASVLGTLHYAGTRIAM